MVILLVFTSNFPSSKLLTLFSHSSHESRGSSLMLSITKLFLLDLSSRSTNFLQISTAHIGFVVCITPTSSFVLFSSLYLFIYVRNTLVYNVLDETKTFFEFFSVCFHQNKTVVQPSALVMLDVLISSLISCFVNNPFCLVSYFCNISLKIYLIFLIVTIFSV